MCYVTLLFIVYVHLRSLRAVPRQLWSNFLILMATCMFSNYSAQHVYPKFLHFYKKNNWQEILQASERNWKRSACVTFCFTLFLSQLIFIKCIAWIHFILHTDLWAKCVLTAWVYGVFHQKERKRSSCVSFWLVLSGEENKTLQTIRTDPGFLRNSSRSHSRQPYTVVDTPLCVGEHVRVCGPVLLACDCNGWVRHSVCVYTSLSCLTFHSKRGINSQSYENVLKVVFSAVILMDKWFPLAAV